MPEPERTLTLRELVARVLKAKLLVLPAAEEARRAGLLNNLGVALSALGRRADALEAAQEAVAIRRKLAASNPQAFLPNLAGSLNNLGILLSDLGRREDALAPSEESVDRYRKLAASNPQAFLPNLATSLGSFGSILQALEFHEEAARAFKEGLQHLVPFYRDLPQAFTGLAKWMVQAYLQSCREAGLEPDAALLSQFI